MATVLPAWNGHVVSAIHRMGIIQSALAAEIGISRQHLCEIINSEKTSDYTRSLVEDGLRSYAGKHGIDYDRDIIAPEKESLAGLTSGKE